MSTFLELCSLLATRSGAVGAAPAAVTGQTGRQAKCVDWIMNAWLLIQNANPNWLWMQGEATLRYTGASTAVIALTINQMTYTAAQILGTYTGSRLASEGFAEWKGDRPDGGILYRPWTLYDNSIGQSDEAPLREIAYPIWRTKYDRGTHDAQRPTEYCLAPDRTIRFGPKPDAAYVVRGEYVKTPQVLAANSDTPEMPSRFHELIVWRAIMLIAGHDESDPAYKQAAAKYAEMMLNLMRDQLPSLDTSGAWPIG